MTKSLNEIDDRAAKEREFKARIAFNGFNQRKVAQKVGVDPALVCRTVKGTERNKRVIAFIEQLPLTATRRA